MLFPLSSASYKDGMIVCDSDIVSGTLIRCDLWNQGCFDVALYVDSTLFTFQVTMAKSHSLLLNYVTDVRNTLLDEGVVVNRVVHVGIVQKSKVQSFRFADAMGMGRPTRRKNRIDNRVKVVKAGEIKIAKVCGSIARR